jgi:repressor LexA
MSPVNSVEDGETAAVWIKDAKEITLKKVYRDKDMVRLQPANKHYKPLTNHPFNIELQGKVIAVLRNLLYFKKE